MLFTTIKITPKYILLLACLFCINITQPLHAAEKYIDDSREIFEVIDLWAEAWINLDADTYISYYSRNYRPNKKTSHRLWAADRRHRFAVQKWIKLNITGMVISKVNNNSYNVNFKQRYKSDSFRDNVRKEILFKKEQGQWKIYSENDIKQ